MTGRKQVALGLYVAIEPVFHNVLTVAAGVAAIVSGVGGLWVGIGLIVWGVGDTTLKGVAGFMIVREHVRRFMARLRRR